MRDGDERAEARWSRVSEASRGRTDKTAESGGTMGARTESRSDEGVPGNAKVDPEDPGSATDRCEDVEVEPGGETKARRSGHIAHEDTDTIVDDEVEGMRRDAQVDRESAGTR